VIPDAQPLPYTWKPFFKDVESQAVRGGHRGQGITAEMEAYEQRLAGEHAMAMGIYEDRRLKAERPTPEASRVVVEMRGEDKGRR
jgi:hypothetical protein